MATTPTKENVTPKGDAYRREGRKKKYIYFLFVSLHKYNFIMILQIYDHSHKIENCFFNLSR